MIKRKICIVTGSRAEYGLLYWLMKGIQNDPAFELQVVATGMHLSPEFGLTYLVIEQDGFQIDAKVEMLLSSDTATGVAKSIGLGVVGFADVFDRLKPDVLVLLGDRYEMLAAAQAALVEKIPIAHIAGGDTTEGAFDEAIRHSITKMSHLHFATNDNSAKRIRQLGEDPQAIFNVGSLGVEYIVHADIMSKDQLEDELGFKFKDKNLLITFHPPTLSVNEASAQFREFLEAVDSIEHDIGLIITKPNADPEGRILTKMIDDFVSSRPYAKAFTSLGQRRYLSVIAQVDVVVGNSSSGLYEVPSFKKPTVNIGDRQEGRIKANSVIDCLPIATDIANAINHAFELDCSATVNPYGRGDSSSRIIQILRDIPDFNKLTRKKFFDLENDED